MPPKAKLVKRFEQGQIDWASKIVPQLKSELTTRGLSLTGKKSDLVARLEANDRSESAVIAPVREVGGVESEQDVDWKSYTVPELKEELTSRGLSLAGMKADLISRLEADDGNVGALGRDQVGENIIEDEEKTDWNSFTIPKLKEELTTRGLRVSGKKSDLVARLDSHVEGETIDSAPAPKRTKTSNAAPRPQRSLSSQSATGHDPDLTGPLARDIIVHKHMNRETGERRQRDFVPAPDNKFLAKLWRIRNERMFMLDRRMGQDRKGHSCQIFDIAGSTGNIYKVTIGRSPSCDCMDAVS